MNYRIRIMKSENGKLVFDRYASDAELEVLKPKADGSGVERAEVLPHIITGKPTLVFDDVSDTHFVEWGFEMNGKKYYENDKLESQIDETIYYNTNHQCFAIGMMWLEVCGSNGENETCYDVSNIYDGFNPNVIGNVWGSK